MVVDISSASCVCYFFTCMW